MEWILIKPVADILKLYPHLYRFKMMGLAYQEHSLTAIAFCWPLIILIEFQQYQNYCILIITSIIN